MMGTKSDETRDITVINVFKEGPAVSLKGSPTVSPTTLALCASEPEPPNLPVSIYYHTALDPFKALSQSSGSSSSNPSSLTRIPR